MRRVRNKSGPKPIYPWERWFASGSFIIQSGRDYRCATHGMANQIRNKASMLGKSVSLKVGLSSIAVRVR